ncbi:MAG: hypothetical protein ACT4P6_11530 [Gemmatimonadaceae bacterium]
MCTLRMFAIGMLFLAVAPPFAAGQTRTSVAVGATWLHFDLGGSGAISAHWRIQRDAQELNALVAVPFAKAAAVPDCPQQSASHKRPQTFCLERSHRSA